MLVGSELSKLREEIYELCLCTDNLIGLMCDHTHENYCKRELLSSSLQLIRLKVACSRA